jgi:hypothetical protein
MSSSCNARAAFRSVQAIRSICSASGLVINQPSLPTGSGDHLAAPAAAFLHLTAGIQEQIDGDVVVGQAAPHRRPSSAKRSCCASQASGAVISRSSSESGRGSPRAREPNTLSSHRGTRRESQSPWRTAALRQWRRDRWWSWRWVLGSWDASELRIARMAGSAQATGAILSSMSHARAHSALCDGLAPNPMANPGRTVAAELSGCSHHLGHPDRAGIRRLSRTGAAAIGQPLPGKRVAPVGVTPTQEPAVKFRRGRRTGSSVGSHEALSDFAQTTTTGFMASIL